MAMWVGAPHSAWPSGHCLVYEAGSALRLLLAWECSHPISHTAVSLARLGVVFPLPCSSSHLASVKLKEEDFPSLSSSAAPTLSSARSLTYTATAKKSSFQEEDFPALVSKVRPGSKTVSTLASAWNNGSSKKAVQAVPASSPGLGQPAKKPALAGSGRGSRKSSVATSSEDSGADGTTAKEVRSAPTMVDVSSLLAASSSQTFIKVGKKKRVGSEKQRPASPPVLQEEPPPAPPSEKAPEAKHPGGLGAPGRAAAVLNGHLEKSVAPCPASKEPPGLKKPPAAGEPLLPQEDFPALGSSAPPRMPPPPGKNCRGPWGAEGGWLLHPGH